MFLLARKTCVRCSLLMFCCVLQWTTAYGADPVSEETLAQRRKDIASRSETQRQELVKKYEQYQRLSPDERRKVEDLHRATEADPNLKKVMDRYTEWANHLDPEQREQLRRATTPEQKRHLVERFYTEQTKRKDDGGYRGDQPPPGKFRPGPSLSSDELKTVMTALETAVFKAGIIDRKTQSLIAGSEGTARYKLLMRAIGDYHHPRDGESVDFELPGAAKTALVEVIQRGEGRPWLKEVFRNSSNSREQRAKYFYYLMVSTVEEAWREAQGPDSGKVKDAYLSSLAPEKQARFTQQGLDKHDPKLMHLHVEEIRQAFSKAGDLPPLERDANGRPRLPGDLFPQYKNRDGDGDYRPFPGRKPEPMPEGRRRGKPDSEQNR